MNLRFEIANEKDIDCIYSLNKELIDRYENIESIEYDKVLKWINKKIIFNEVQYEET